MNYHLTLYKPRKYYYQSQDKVNDAGIMTPKGIKIGYVSYVDKMIIQKRLEKSSLKIQANIDNVMLNVSKLNKGRSKNYQITGYYEWKLLYKKLKPLTDIEFNLSSSQTLTTNVVAEIIAGYDSGCCSECDGRPQYVHKKVPVMYVYVKKL